MPNPYRKPKGPFAVGHKAWEQAFLRPKDLALPTLAKVFIEYKEKSHQYRWPEHVHPRFAEFYYVDRGRVYFQASAGKFSLGQRQGALFLPGERHSFEVVPPSVPNVLTIHFYSPDFLKRLPRLKKISSKPLTLDLVSASTLNDLCAHARAGSHQSGLKVSLDLANILIQLSGLPEREHHQAGNQDRSPRFVQEVENFVRAHLQERLSLTKIAGALRCSVSTLAHEVRRLANETPYQLLLRCRLEKAKELLRQPEASVKEAAYLTGFSSASSLVRAFRRAEKITPTAYRRSLSAASSRSL